MGTSAAETSAPAKASGSIASDTTRCRQVERRRPATRQRLSPPRWAGWGRWRQRVPPRQPRLVWSPARRRLWGRPLAHRPGWDGHRLDWARRDGPVGTRPGTRGPRHVAVVDTRRGVLDRDIALGAAVGSAPGRPSGGPGRRSGLEAPASAPEPSSTAVVVLSTTTATANARPPTMEPSSCLERLRAARGAGVHSERVDDYSS